jgi:uncharacterized protein
MDFQFPTRGLAFNVMAKPAGAVCNLRCSYCYYLEKRTLYEGQALRMSTDTLEEFIKQYIEAQKIPVVTFVWQGGEPSLAGIEFYQTVVRLQQKYANGKRIENAFQTNGTFIDDRWCTFFKEHNFLVGISIDGPENLHNAFRKDTAGEGSWKKVMKGISLLHKHKVEFNTLTTVNRITGDHPLAIYRFLKEIGSGFIQFLPVVEIIATENVAGSGLHLITPSHQGKKKVTEWSVRPEQYGKFLTAVFDEWVRNDVGRYFVQLFDVTLANWVGQIPGLCVFSETCGDALVIEHNGDVYSCDHFVYPEHYLGNIHSDSLTTLATSEKQLQFGQAKLRNLPRYCLECEYRFACHGECPKHRWEKTPDGEEGLNYLCPAYKMFFRHVHPYMQYMADQLAKKQAPANVMAWIKQNERDQMANQKKRLSVGRNDPCPCGSGRKFKSCCMGKLTI